jgi:uncharacterized protein YqgV (UPF0045/DUF77 family)
MRLLQCPKEAIMLASFSVVPMGAGEGIKEIVAEALTIVDGSGLSYQLGPMHTVIEGEPEQVLDVILRCHRRVLELAPRVLPVSPWTTERGPPVAFWVRSAMLSRF